MPTGNRYCTNICIKKASDDKRLALRHKKSILPINIILFQPTFNLISPFSCVSLALIYFTCFTELLLIHVISIIILSCSESLKHVKCQLQWVCNTSILHLFLITICNKLLQMLLKALLSHLEPYICCMHKVALAKSNCSQNYSGTGIHHVHTQ